MSGEENTRLLIKRTLNADIETVFDAWTKPEQLRRWFAPYETMEVVVSETDVRVGGCYRIVMRTENGEEMGVSGVYREVVRGRKLSFTWAWDGTPDRQSVVTVELSPAPNATNLTLIHERFADQAARDRHQGGWKACLDQFERIFVGTA